MSNGGDGAPGHRRRRPPSSTSAALARDWAWELSGTGYLSASRAEVELRLRGQVDVLLDALLAEPFRAEPARQVGADLAGLHATHPEALRKTLLLLADRLLEDLPIGADVGRYRLTLLLIDLAAGWADAVHAHILAAQEAIYRATDNARSERPRTGAPPPPNPWFDPED